MIGMSEIDMGKTNTIMREEKQKGETGRVSFSIGLLLLLLLLRFFYTQQILALLIGERGERESRRRFPRSFPIYFLSIIYFIYLEVKRSK